MVLTSTVGSLHSGSQCMACDGCEPCFHFRKARLMHVLSVVVADMQGHLHASFVASAHLCILTSACFALLTLPKRGVVCLKQAGICMLYLLSLPPCACIHVSPAFPELAPNPKAFPELALNPKARRRWSCGSCARMNSRAGGSYVHAGTPLPAPSLALCIT